MIYRMKLLLLCYVPCLVVSFTIVGTSRERKFGTGRIELSDVNGGGIFYDGPEGGEERGEAKGGEERSYADYQSTFSSLTRGGRNRQSVNIQERDVVIIGGGLAGLSAAIYLNQLQPDRHITILERSSLKQTASTTVASFAAAGMLAPQSERLPKGPLLDLCLASRHEYQHFIDLVQSFAVNCGDDARQFLQADHDGTVGFQAAGGFLAPAYAGDAVATWAPPEEADAQWLDQYQVRELEPNLHPEIIGGWWFPEDASVDARKLTCALRAACVEAGVEIRMGTKVESLDLISGKCQGILLENGKTIRPKQVLVANGAWMRQLLPVPVESHKGQSLSLRMPTDRPPILKRVLFAQDSYIVPKSDGRIVVGATVEAGSFDPNVTPAGIMHILQHAMELVPGLMDLPIEETWVGLRPTTPDKGPIIGKSPWSNVFLAGGYWRNGVLLAPKTGQLLAQCMAGIPFSQFDQSLMDAFTWDRFTSPHGGRTMVANSRYAASMHPIHTRVSGAGVSAAVGTELGSYSTAKHAKEERRLDREALFSTSAASEGVLEKAARMGKDDALAFNFEGLDLDKPEAEEEEEDDDDYDDDEVDLATSFDGSPGTFTVPSKDSDNDDIDLDSVYSSIQSNQATRQLEMNDAIEEERVDLGYRIFRVTETGDEIEVPPYTSPDDILLQKEQTAQESTNNEASAETEESSGSTELDRSTTTGSSDDNYVDLSGYIAIEEAYKGQDVVQTMREARIKNRGSSGIDGELQIDESEFPDLGSTTTASAPATTPAVKNEGGEESDDEFLEGGDESAVLDDFYEQIQKNKDSVQVEMEEKVEEEKPDPGYRIYLVDEQGTEHEVPPYTGPQEMEELVANNNQNSTLEGTTVEITPPAPNKNKPESGADSLEAPQESQQDDEPNETTFDGYTVIQQANNGLTRDEQAKAMREARRKNRISDSVDDSQIGVFDVSSDESVKMPVEKDRNNHKHP